MNHRTIALLSPVLLSMSLFAALNVAAAQESDSLPIADAVRHAKVQSTGHKARHVVTDDDLPSHPEESSVHPDDGVASPKPEQPDTSPDGKKDHSATGTEPSQIQKSLQDLREQESFNIQQIASLKEMIAVGPADSRHDVLAHLLEYRCTRLETVRRQLEELEKQVHSAKGGNKPANAANITTAAASDSAAASPEPSGAH